VPRDRAGALLKETVSIRDANRSCVRQHEIHRDTRSCRVHRDRETRSLGSSIFLQTPLSPDIPPCFSSLLSSVPRSQSCSQSRPSFSAFEIRSSSQDPSETSIRITRLWIRRRKREIPGIINTLYFRNLSSSIRKKCVAFFHFRFF